MSDQQSEEMRDEQLMEIIVLGNLAHINIARQSDLLFGLDPDELSEAEANAFAQYLTGEYLRKAFTGELFRGDLWGQ